MSTDADRAPTPRASRRRRVPWRWSGWVERFALSSGPDVMALLVAQGQASHTALEAFLSWSQGSGPVAAHLVGDLEKQADDARHTLVAALRGSFATPVGQEDLFVLSERCDRVVNRVKNIVAEAEILSWEPDAHAARMANDLHVGMTAVVEGFAYLTTRDNTTADAAVTATHCVRGVEHAYRDAMSDLASWSDLREVFTAREMYRFYARAAEALETLADRLWYAVLAEP